MLLLYTIQKLLQWGDALDTTCSYRTEKDSFLAKTKALPKSKNQTVKLAFCLMQVPFYICSPI